MGTHRLTSEHKTISDKIRALDAAGMPRAEIARTLGRRYQHVRNVLEADKLKHLARSAPPRPPKPTGDGLPSLSRLEVARDGSLTLPPDLVRRFGVQGGVVVAQLDGDSLILMGAQASLRRARKLVAKLVGSTTSMADELIQERREESAHG